MREFMNMGGTMPVLSAPGKPMEPQVPPIPALKVWSGVEVEKIAD